MAESEKLQRREHGRVGVVAHQHRDRWRTEQAVRLDVPAGLSQHIASRGGEAYEVGHRRARDKADGAFARQVEKVEQPTAGDCLDSRRRRCRVVVAGVLAPSAGQPVGSDADRMRAADHPAEKAGTGHRVNAGFYPRDQLVEHAQASTALLGERFAQGLNSFTIVLLRSLQPIGQVVAVARGVTGRSTEKLVCRAFRHDVPQKDDASV